MLDSSLKKLSCSTTLAIIVLTGKVSSTYCDGGHLCSLPKECCTLGCCYPYTSTGYRPPISSANVPPFFNLIVWNHWFFWCLLFLLLLSCMGGCGLWRRRHFFPGRCCRDSQSDEERSEPDSAGSCYPPPHYSRCASFHHAPPPYTEVTSKPDLYPLVISYGPDTAKSGGNYLMVQYFRNYIVRPALGSLSAESTADSLSSSFLCQSAAETDSHVPPSYEEQARADGLPRSASSVSADISTLQVQPNNRRASSAGTDVAPPQAMEALQHHHENAEANSAILSTSMTAAGPAILKTVLPAFKTISNSFSAIEHTSDTHHYTEPTNIANEIYSRPTNLYLSTFKRNNRSAILSTSVDSITDNGYPVHQYSSDVILAQPKSYCDNSELHYYSTDIINHPLRILNIADSYSSEDNLSQPRGSLQDFVSSDGLSHSQPSNLEMNHYSTSSDVSSLQGCGTPDSPPRATSPTGEFRDILDKIQQLPQQGFRSSDRSIDWMDGSAASGRDETDTNEESVLLTDSLQQAQGIDKLTNKFLPVRPNKLSIKRSFPVRSKTFYMPFCQIGKKGRKTQTNSYSAPVTPVTGFPSPSSIALNFLTNSRMLGSRHSEQNAEDASPLLQEDSGNKDEIF